MGAVERWKAPELERLTVDQIKFIANANVIPDALRGKPAQIIAAILKGRALGLDDLHALEAIHFINGKAAMSSQTMGLLARRAGHSISAEVTETSATVKGKRGDTGDEMTVTFTIEDAKRAGLAEKDTWKKYPQSMLMARAVSQLCRWLFPDVLAGAAYTPEELELSPEEQIVESIGQVGPPPDDGAPDDTIDGDSELVEEPSDVLDGDGAYADVAGSMEAHAPEPSSTDSIPAMDGVGEQSTFEQMAAHAQETRRRKAGTA